MSDTDQLDIKEKVQILFNNFLGYPATNENFAYYEETKVQKNNYIYGSNVFLDEIPPNTITDTNLNIEVNEVTITDSNKQLYNLTNSNDVEKIEEIKYNGNLVVIKYHKLKLSEVTDSPYAYYYDISGSAGKSLLADTIQSNEKMTSSIRPYLYTLFTDNDISIPSSPAGGNWILDIRP